MTFTGRSTISSASTWLIATVLLSLPLSVGWTANRTAAAWRIPLALAASVLPPLGLIGWASPVASVGVLFPGTAWLGLATVLVAPGLVLLGGTRIWIAIVVAGALTGRDRILNPLSHAKLVIRDERAVLVGSANLTSHALGGNFEAGVLLGGAAAEEALFMIDGVLRAKTVYLVFQTR